MTDNQHNDIKTTRTSFRILEAIRETDGARVTDIANQLNLSKSSVYKHLSTLEQERYIVKNGQSYQVSLKFLSFGEDARKRRKIYEIAKPEMAELANQTNEMSNLLVEEYGRGILLHRETSDKAISLDTYAGKETDLHTTANGKAILSQLPESRVYEIIDEHGLAEKTENSITDTDELLNVLAEIRERGWAYDNEERLIGLQCVAVPIVDTNGEVLGAVSVSGPASRIQGEHLHEEIPELLLKAKNVIEMDVAYK